MQSLAWLAALCLAGAFLGGVTLTAILFALWDIRAELRILNFRKRD